MTTRYLSFVSICTMTLLLFACQASVTIPTEAPEKAPTATQESLAVSSDDKDVKVPESIPTQHLVWSHGVVEWGKHNVEPGAIVFHEGQYHMFFNGLTNWPSSNNIGYATSLDGLTWTLVGNEPIIHTVEIGLETFTFFASSALVDQNGQWYLYFYTLDRPSDAASGAIGLATAPAPQGPWTVNSQLVLEPGSGNNWDSHRVTQPSVVKSADGFMMYYAGFANDHRNSARQIGLAFSSDGQHWVKHREPVLTIGSTDAWDGQRVFQPHVVQVDDGWLMLYKANKGFLQQQAYGFAFSQDGRTWLKHPDNPVIDAEKFDTLSRNWYAELVYQDEKLFVYLEVLSQTTSDIYAIVIDSPPEFSIGVQMPNAFTYQNMGQVLAPGDGEAWDRGAIYIPDVHYFNGKYHLFYSGFPNARYTNGAIGYATSDNGIDWVKHPDNPVLQGTKALPKVQSGTAMFNEETDQWVMYVDATSNNRTASHQIFQATAMQPQGPWALNSTAAFSRTQTWDRVNNPAGIIATEDGYALYYFAWGRIGVNLGLATSTDGLTWMPYDNLLTTDRAFDGSDPVLQKGAVGTWDAKGISANQVIKTERGYETFYTGFSKDPLNTLNSSPHNLGYAISNDGVHWTKHPDNPLIPLSDERILPAVGVVFVDGQYFIYYDMDGGVNGIGLIIATPIEGD